MKNSTRLSYMQLVAVLVGLFFFGWYMSTSYPSAFASTDKLAHEVVAQCAQNENRPLCYEKEVPALMDQGLTMERAFEVTKAVQALDPDYHYCHVLAHNISAKEAAKDLSKWKDVVARAPSGICGNGGLHGAFQERFRTDAVPDMPLDRLAEELAGVCDPRGGWKPTFLERSSCMHGVGHLAMYVTNADIGKSVALCNTLGQPASGEDFRRTCIDGAFMQIFQPLEPEDTSLVEHIVPSKAKRQAFCERFEGVVRTSCIKESWPLIVDTITSPEGFSGICAPLSGNAEEYRYCATGVIYIVFGRLEYDAGAMSALCAAVPEKLSIMCTARTASRFVETDWRNIPQALAGCSEAPGKSKNTFYK